MTPEQLHQYMHQITKSEEKYREVGRNTFFDTLEDITLPGEPPIKAKLLNNIFNYPIRNQASTIYLKKHSRFCPTPYHIHEWIEINYMYSGNCTQTINRNEYHLQQNQVILVDKDAPHEIGYLNENDILFSFMIKPEYLNSNFFNRLSKDSIVTEFFINAMNQEKEHNNFIYFPSHESRKLPIYIAELACEMIAPSSYNIDIIDSLLTLILCELIDVYNQHLENSDKITNASSMISILRYIENNYKTCSLDSVAREFNLSTSYLSALIKKKLNTNYKDLIQKQKLRSSAILLKNTEQSIVEIAHAVGYENMNFFYKKFKDMYGCSPKEYRRQYR